LPAPDIDAYSRGQYVAPVTETENVLVSIWAELLGFEFEEISVTANFFDIGANSMDIVKVVNKINSEFRHNVSVIDLFTYTNIELLAAYISRNANKQHKATHRSKRIRKKSGLKRQLARRRAHRDEKLR
jgi:acyl carrier protein